jgi:hypothetical protein
MKMAASAELKKEQAERLFTLLKIKKVNKNQVEGLEEAIGMAMSGMSNEEVAWVEKLVEEKIKG